MALLPIGRKSFITLPLSLPCLNASQCLWRLPPQAPLFGFFEATMRKRGKMEVFHLANSVKPSKVEMETDLFAGIEDIG
jgi:hypothetical protein